MERVNYKFSKALLFISLQGSVKGMFNGRRLRSVIINVERVDHAWVHGIVQVEVLSINIVESLFLLDSAFKH